MNDDDLAERKAKQFLELLDKNWKNHVSVSAHQTIQEKRWYKQDDIPLTKNVTTLRDHLRMVEDKAKEELTKELSLTAYKMLNETVLAQVIIFNKLREGESSHLTLDTYETASTNPINKDIYETLSPLEKELSKLLTHLEVQGKRGRKVPVFLTQRMKESIDLLINRRDEAGIPAENPYLFARPGTMTNIRGCDCLQKYAEESKAENPELLRSAKLRKQVATLCQLLDLNEKELEQVARLMGHDIRVHRDFYLQTDKAFQIAKISKLLFAMEQGTESLNGKNLNTTNPSVNVENPMSPSETVPQEGKKRAREVDDDGCLDLFSPRKKLDPCNEDDQSPGISLSQRLPPRMRRRKRKKADKQIDEGSDLFCPEKTVHQSSEDGSSDRDDQRSGKNLVTQKKNKKKREKQMVKGKEPLQATVRRPWSEAERMAVEKHLGNFLAERRVPWKRDCLRAIQADKALSERSWKSVKNYVCNKIVTLTLKKLKYEGLGMHHFDP
uniref:uncharacterized protein LOC117249113 n=1 Tax=Epinephelus lanceolatus TaxID=310571 RepID=UPI001446AF9D|nr:uncharacterized protein LOC117249113 [Epinephelus lanceolatus]